MDKNQNSNLVAPVRRRFSKAERAAHLANWEKSALSARDYAREHGMTDKNLYAWRRQTRRLGEGKCVRTTGGGGTFVPVRLNAPAWPAGGSLRVSLRSAAGLEVEVSGAPGITELVSAIKALKEGVFDV